MPTELLSINAFTARISLKALRRDRRVRGNGMQRRAAAVHQHSGTRERGTRSRLRVQNYHPRDFLPAA